MGTSPNLLRKFWSSLWSSKANTLETIGLLAFFVPSIVDPMIYWAMVARNKTLTKHTKDTMIRQNLTHHAFNLIIEVLSLAASRPIVGYFFKGHPRVHFYKQISGFVALMVAKSIIRPFVMMRFAHIKPEKILQNPPVTPILRKPSSPSIQSHKPGIIYFPPFYAHPYTNRFPAAYPRV